MAEDFNQKFELQRQRNLELIEKLAKAELENRELRDRIRVLTDDIDELKAHLEKCVWIGE